MVKIMQIMEREIISAMQQVGATNIHELIPEMVRQSNSYVYPLSCLMSLAGRTSQLAADWGQAMRQCVPTAEFRLR